MYIKVMTQKKCTHGRALDVPARTPLSPRAVPHRLSGLGPFPEHKIKRVSLVLIYCHPGTSLHILKPAARELAVVVETIHSIENVGSSFVCMAFLKEEADHIDDLGNMVRGLWFMSGLPHLEGAHVLMELLNVSF